MTDPIALPTIEAQVTEKLSRIDKRLAELETAANEMTDLRAERKRLVAVLAIYSPKTVTKKPRARRGKADEIVLAILADGIDSEDAVLDLALKAPDAPSRSALRRAVKNAFEDKTVGAAT